MVSVDGRVSKLCISMLSLHITGERIHQQKKDYESTYEKKKGVDLNEFKAYPAALKVKSLGRFRLSGCNEDLIIVHLTTLRSHSGSSPLRGQEVAATPRLTCCARGGAASGLST